MYFSLKYDISNMEIDEKYFIVKFGEKLRELRLKSNLSQEMLAIDANIPVNQIGRIERAEINTTINTVYKLSKALKIPILDFFEF